MTTYTIHESAGVTTKIELDDDSGQQKYNYVYLTFSSGSVGSYSSGAWSITSNDFTIPILDSSGNIYRNFKVDYISTGTGDFTLKNLKIYT